MATIKLSSIVTDIRGKLGGVIFARGKNGSYAKSFAKPVNGNTVGQQIQRGNMTNYAAKWRTLTDEDRNAWINATSQFKYRNRVGDVSQYSGFQLYMKTNLILEAAAKDQ